MHIILVRHGKAESGISNPERPLTPDGKNCIESLGQRLADISGRIDQIWHSGILRACQTAEILEKYISPLNGLVKIKNLSPHGNPEIMQKTLNDERRNLILVSHLPFLDYLGNLMLTGNMEAEIIHFSAGSAAKFIKTKNNWGQAWMIDAND
ncbi:phosphohistidine phosphatase SixA [bacterium]|nr:phosphohistidine phosphatase SixA [bacterium]